MIDKPSVLLLPGNMCDERLWRDVLPSFQGWDTACRVPNEETIHAMAVACLDHHPGQLLPIGFSMGAIVAMAMADIAADRIAGIGLISTNVGADDPSRSAARLPQQRTVVDDGVIDVVIDELKPAYFAPGDRRNDDLRHLIVDMATRLGPDVFVKQSEALRTRRSYEDVLPRLDVPVFIACGEEDALCPPELHIRFAAAAKDSELHIIPGAGHVLPLEQPDRLNRLLVPWLATLERKVSCPTLS